MPDVAEESAIRDELRFLIERIPDGDIATARKFLRSLIDPVELSLLSAPPDDEPLSPQERNATEEAERRELRGEELVPHEEILREFGLDVSEPAPRSGVDRWRP